MKLFKQIITYTFFKLFGAFSGLLLIPIFLKNLPQSDFGIIGLLWIVIPLLSKAVTWSIDFGVYIKYNKSSNKQISDYVYHSLIFIFINSILIVSAYFICVIFLDFKDIINTPNTIVLLIILSVIFKVLFQYFIYILNIQQKAFFCSILAFIEPVLVTILTFIYLTYYKQNYAGYLIASIFVNSILAIYGIIYMINEFKLTIIKFNFSTIFDLLKIGLPASIGTIVAIILSGGDRFVIKIFFTLEHVAIYTLGYKIAESVTAVISQGLTQAFTPASLKQASEDINNYYLEIDKTNIKLVSIFTFVIVLLSLVPFNLILKIMNAKNYSGSHEIFLIALFGISIFHIDQIISPILSHLERIKINLYIVIFTTVLNIVLNIIFVPLFGIIAAAVTTAISYLFMLILRFIAIKRYTKMVVNYFNYFKIIGILLITQIILFYIQKYFKDRLIIQLFLSLITFLFFLIFNKTTIIDILSKFRVLLFPKSKNTY